MPSLKIAKDFFVCVRMYWGKPLAEFYVRIRRYGLPLPMDIKTNVYIVSRDYIGLLKS